MRFSVVDFSIIVITSVNTSKIANVCPIISSFEQLKKYLLLKRKKLHMSGLLALY
jgi:hypothetical protein